MNGFSFNTSTGIISTLVNGEVVEEVEEEDEGVKEKLLVIFQQMKEIERLEKQLKEKEEKPDK